MAKALALFLLAALSASLTEAVTLCNADNCLRQLRGNGYPASSYCTSYLTTARPAITPPPLTVVVTATRTVFAVHSPSGQPIEYITRKGAPYIAPNKRKRNLDLLPREPIPVTVAPIKARQAPLPLFASSCTGAPDRLSSACTCLIGYTADRVTVSKTVTQSTYTFTTQVCIPTDVYNLRQSWQGDFTSPSPDLSYALNPGKSVQECCNLCYHNPNCVAYYIDDETGFCGLMFARSTDHPQPNDSYCPKGLLEVYDPYSGSNFPGRYEFGMCGYLIYSDE
ncbi:hypothetical protein H072_9447 [Dactylellina haptotyla CBS 200.50]|uniref:Apple domain-containing protein n=1 Tax=Dactylellina haptotyla (strain CBS 200.50) TaxID=1284197 RepID=S8A756_DACHA|nr:hypothetical protein H072_9447 [Dactylellina haptotyla CBS 200.50]